MRLEIPIAPRVHDRKSVAPAGGLDLHLLDGLLKRFGVVQRSDIYAGEVAECAAIKRRNAGGEID